MRYTVSPLLGAALLPSLFQGMFAPLRVPGRFARGFPGGLSVRPGQLRAESQDGVTMVPAAAAMRRRYRELDMPVMIMAGSKDRVVDVGRHAVRLHDEMPHSTLRLIDGVGHMVHHAVPEEIADAVDAIDAQSSSRWAPNSPVEPREVRGRGEMRSTISPV
jgi:pimeloyl-ACP methyl ester carboxylesterase